MPKLTVQYGNEYMEVDTKTGNVSRPAIGMSASGQWQIVGAVTLNNFGQVVRRYSQTEVLTNSSAIPWRHKNGKQRTHMVDLDHGTRRTWMSPTHQIY